MPTPPSPMTASVIASSPEKTRKSSGTAAHTSAICEMLPLASFTPDDVGNLSQAQQRRSFDVRSGATGDVVQHQRLGRRFGNRLEVLVDAFLRGLVVVGRCGQDVVHARTRRRLLWFCDGLARVVRGRARHDGHAAAGSLNRQVDYAQPLVMSQSRRLAGGAARAPGSRCPTRPASAPVRAAPVRPCCHLAGRE